MEGALPSVVAGLVERPVVAVPTSVGYGASFGGVAALLGMLNSCATGIGVVNIDNGFGAATLVHRIARGRADGKCCMSRRVLFLDCAGGAAGDMLLCALTEAAGVCGTRRRAARDARLSRRFARVAGDASRRLCRSTAAGALRPIRSPASPQSRRCRMRSSSEPECRRDGRRPWRGRSSAGWPRPRAEVHGQPPTRSTSTRWERWTRSSISSAPAWRSSVSRSMRWCAPSSRWVVDTVRCEHGELPLPAPAVAAMLPGVPVRPVDVEGETVTPTGAALVTDSEPDRFGHAGDDGGKRRCWWRARGNTRGCPTWCEPLSVRRWCRPPISQTGNADRRVQHRRSRPTRLPGGDRSVARVGRARCLCHPAGDEEGPAGSPDHRDRAGSGGRDRGRRHPARDLEPRMSHLSGHQVSSGAAHGDRRRRRGARCRSRSPFRRDGPAASPRVRGLCRARPHRRGAGAGRSRGGRRYRVETGVE